MPVDIMCLLSNLAFFPLFYLVKLFEFAYVSLIYYVYQYWWTKYEYIICVFRL